MEATSSVEQQAVRVGEVHDSLRRSWLVIGGDILQPTKRAKAGAAQADW